MFASTASDIENASHQQTVISQLDEGRLRSSDVPRWWTAVVHLIKGAYLIRRAGSTGWTGRIVGNVHAAIILRKCE